MFIHASTAMLLQRVTLVAAVIMAMPAEAQERTIPNFTSADFGLWERSRRLGNPIYIGATELVCQRLISTISLRRQQPIHAGRVRGTPVRGSSSGFPILRTPI
jgi:hypothetical protein